MADCRKKTALCLDTFDPTVSATGTATRGRLFLRFFNRCSISALIAKCSASIVYQSIGAHRLHAEVATNTTPIFYLLCRTAMPRTQQ